MDKLGSIHIGDDLSELHGLVYHQPHLQIFYI